MRKLWTAADIIGGAFIVRESSPLGATNLGFKRTVTFKIGFSFDTQRSDYGLCNALTDGFYKAMGSKEQLAEYLNKDEYGYRSLTKPEFLEMAEHMKQGYAEFMDEYKKG